MAGQAMVIQRTSSMAMVADLPFPPKAERTPGCSVERPFPAACERRPAHEQRNIKVQDGTEIFYKDWGKRPAHRVPPRLAAERRRLGQPDAVLPRHRAIRVIAHDRRGHGRSTQTDDGNDMDTYAADVAALVDASRPARTPSMSATPPAAARSPATSPATARAVSPRPCSSAPCRR